jgi:hypothetical protein
LHSRHPSLPIVLTSGFDCNPLAEQFGEDRSVRVLAKPFDETEILRALQELHLGQLPPPRDFRGPVTAWPASTNS